MTYKYVCSQLEYDNFEIMHGCTVDKFPAKVIVSQPLTEVFKKNEGHPFKKFITNT